MEDAFGCIAALVAGLITITLGPILCFLGGYVSGLVLQLTVGGFVASGLNLILNTTRFTAGQLPIICGALAVVGSFFQSYLRTKSKD